jgi:methylenetetrahydrofolate reductase (NADPH)
VLIDGGFALTAEITPPAATGRQALLDKALPLKGWADAVNVTDGAGARAHLSSLVAAGLLVEAGIDPILQFTCRDRNRISLQSDLLGAAVLGVRNLLVLRGDDPAAGDQPEATPVFDLDALSLLSTAASIRDHGTLPSGREVGEPAPFFIGAADMPFDPPPGWKPDRLRAKLDAGAEFVQTQICMDTDLVRRYAARLIEEGLGDRLHLIVGLAVPASARSARWMHDALFGAVIPDVLVERLEGAMDEKAEGRRISVELIQQLSELPGVAGAHIMAPLNESSIPAVIEESGIAGRRG